MNEVSTFFTAHGSDAGRIFTLFVCSVVAFYLMVSVLEDPRPREPAKPSSFFILENLVSKAWYNWLCYFFGGTLALAYAALALFSPGVFSQIKKGFLSYVEFVDVSTHAKDSIEFLAGYIPDWADPVFVLLLALVLFASFVRNALVGWRDMVVGGAGLYRIADDVALDVAKQLLAAHSGNYDNVLKTLKPAISELPLPEEYIGSPHEFRLAYQLLWMNKDVVRERGIIDGFEAFRKKFRLIDEDESSNASTRKLSGSPFDVKMNMSHLFVTFVLFCVLMGFFIIMATSFTGWADNHNLAWPNPQKYGWLGPVENAIRNTLTYVVPTLLGLYMLPVRRRACYKQESYVMSLTVVATFQWVTAFILHQFFSILGVLWNLSNGSRLGFLEDLFAPDRQVWNFTYSIVPCIVLLLILTGRAVGIPKWLSAIGITIVAGILFLGCDYLSECAAPSFNNYYVFQWLFGMAVAACLFVVVAISEAPGAHVSPSDGLVPRQPAHG